MVKPAKIVKNASSRALRSRAKDSDASLGPSGTPTETRVQGPKLTESERLLLRWRSDGLDIEEISRVWNQHMGKSFSTSTIKGKLTTALKKVENNPSTTRAVDSTPSPDREPSQSDASASLDKMLGQQTTGASQDRNEGDSNSQQDESAGEERGNEDAHSSKADIPAYSMPFERASSAMELQSKAKQSSRSGSRVSVSNMTIEEANEDEELNVLDTQPPLSHAKGGNPEVSGDPQQSSSKRREHQQAENLSPTSRKRSIEQRGVEMDEESSDTNRSKRVKSQENSPSSDPTKTKTFRRLKGKEVGRAIEALGILTEDTHPDGTVPPSFRFSETQSSAKKRKESQKKDTTVSREMSPNKQQGHDDPDTVPTPPSGNSASVKRKVDAARLEPKSSMSATRKRRKFGDQELAAQFVDDHAPVVFKTPTKHISIAPIWPSVLDTNNEGQTAAIITARSAQPAQPKVTDPRIVPPQSTAHISGAASAGPQHLAQGHENNNPVKKPFKTTSAYFAEGEGQLCYINDFFDSTAEGIAGMFSEVNCGVDIAIQRLFDWWTSEDVEEDRISIARDVSCIMPGVLKILTKSDGIEARNLFLQMLDNKNGEPGPYGIKPIEGFNVAHVIIAAMLHEEVWSQELAPRMGLPVMGEEFMELLEFLHIQSRKAARTDWGGYPPGKEAEVLRYFWRDYRKAKMKGPVFAANIAALAEKILGRYEESMLCISRDTKSGFDPRRRLALLVALKDAIKFKCKLELYGSQYKFRWVPCHAVFDRDDMKAFDSEISRALPGMKLRDDKSHRVRFALAPALFEQRFVGQNRSGMEARERERRIASLKAEGKGDELGDLGFRPSVCLRPAHVVLFDGMVMKQGDDRGKRFYPEDSLLPQYW